MQPRRRNSPQGVDEKERWLPSDVPIRSRPWAYEELLFGLSRDREQTRELGAVLEELHNERAELARLYRELDEHLAQIASLEKRLKDLTPATERVEPNPGSSRRVHPTRAASADEGDSRASLAQRSYSLARCEGFEVESPTGPVGFVEGLRFISRIDQPDLLEVRGGRFRRQRLLIPIEQVEDVRVTEGRVFVRSAPLLTGDLLAELVGRLRRALHSDQAAS
jgi:hypothetical protein